MKNILLIMTALGFLLFAGCSEREIAAAHNAVLQAQDMLEEAKEHKAVALEIASKLTDSAKAAEIIAIAEKNIALTQMALDAAQKNLANAEAGTPWYVILGSILGSVATGYAGYRKGLYSPTPSKP